MFKPWGSEKDKNKEIDESKLELKPDKKDYWAMMIAMFTTILPVVLLIWAALALIVALLFLIR